MAIYMMRDDGGYTPGSNTIAYYPLESNGNDYSGNGHNLTWNGTPTYTISGGTKSVVSLNGSTLGKIANLSGTYTNYTFNVWCKPTNNSTTRQELFDNYKWASDTGTDTVYLNFNGTSTENGGYKDFAYQYRPNGGTTAYQNVYGTTNRAINTWYNVCLTSTSSGVKLYLNGTQIVSNATTGKIILDSGYNFIGGRYQNNDSTYKNRFIGYMSEFIFDGTTWTAQEVLDYYNDTKSNYGITDYTYSYDFRNKSVATLTNDGWTIVDNNPSFDADGMYYSSWSAGARLYLGSSETVLSSANTIKLVCNFKITNSSKRGVSLQIMREPPGWSNDFGFFSNHNWYEYRLNGSTISTTSSSGWSGVKTSTIVYDLVNKTYTYSGVTSKTGSLTDAQITLLRNGCYINCLVADNGVRLQDITIECS